METAGYVALAAAGIAGGMLAGYFAFRPSTSSAPEAPDPTRLAGGVQTGGVQMPTGAATSQRHMLPDGSQVERLPPSILNYEPAGAVNALGQGDTPQHVWQRVAGHPGVRVAPASPLTEPRNPYEASSFFIPQNLGMELAQGGEIVTIGDVYYVKPRGELANYVSAQVGGVRMTTQVPEALVTGPAVRQVTEINTPLFPGRPGVTRQLSAADPWDDGLGPYPPATVPAGDVVAETKLPGGVEKVTYSPGRNAVLGARFPLTGKPLRTPGGSIQAAFVTAPGQIPSRGVTYR